MAVTTERRTSDRSHLRLRAQAILGRTLQHGSLSIRVDALDRTFRRSTPSDVPSLLSDDQPLGQGGFGAAWSVTVMEDNPARGLKKGDRVVAKAVCDCPSLRQDGHTALYHEHLFHSHMLSSCGPSSAPLLFGSVIELAATDPSPLRRLSLAQCRDDCPATSLMLMEKMEGESKLADLAPLRADKGRFVNEMILPLMDTVLCLHQKANIFHRDVKLQNILYRKDETGRFLFKLADYGIAESLDAPLTPPSSNSNNNNDNNNNNKNGNSGNLAAKLDALLDEDYKKMERRYRVQHGTPLYFNAPATLFFRFGFGEKCPLSSLQTLRTYTDVSALSLALRSAYDSSPPIPFYLQFVPSEPRPFTEADWSKRYEVVNSYKYTTQERIPDLEVVIGRLMTNDISLKEARDQLAARINVRNELNEKLAVLARR